MITTKEAVDLYVALSDVVFGEMKSGDKMILLQNLRAVKPIAQKFETDRQDAVEKLQTPELLQLEDEIRPLIGTRPEGDSLRKVNEYNRMQADFEKELNACIREMLDEKHDVELRCINESAFDKLLEANKSVKSSHLCTIYQYVA